MIKIQLAVQVSQEFPTGRGGEYLWMKGQPWPIKKEDDARILMIEAFGEEMKEIGPRFSGGKSLKRSIKNEVTGEYEATGEELARTWYTDQARYVSEQMRVFYP